MAHDKQTPSRKNDLKNTAYKQNGHLQKTNIGLAAALFKLTGNAPVRVVPFDLQEEPLVILDLSDENESLLKIDISDPAAFSRYIEEVLEEAGALVGIGKYNEDRTIYRHSTLFDGDTAGRTSADGSNSSASRNFSNPSSSRGTLISSNHEHASGDQSVRSLHLGIDIWIKAGTEVFPAFPGTVHSFQDNVGGGDYGPTIILEHDLKELQNIYPCFNEFLPFYRQFKEAEEAESAAERTEGESSDTFCTLYGHLSRDSLSGLQPGQVVTPKSAIARVGSSGENGAWPPHLHFQIIHDMEGRRGDYPGVCAVRDRDKYLENCPDPNTVLHLPEQRILG